MMGKVDASRQGLVRSELEKKKKGNIRRRGGQMPTVNENGKKHRRRDNTAKERGR